MVTAQDNLKQISNDLKLLKKLLKQDLQKANTLAKGIEKKINDLLKVESFIKQIKPKQKKMLDQGKDTCKVVINTTNEIIKLKEMYKKK